jgi:hypothetical protein
MSNLTKAPSTTVHFSIEAIIALDAFNSAKKAEAEAKKAKAAAEVILREALGEATEGLVNGITAVKVVFSQNTRNDKEALQTAFPEAYEATLVSTPYSYLKAL